MVPLAGDRKPQKILGSNFNESQGQFAPDGKWFAYVSDESGQPQVYVQSFPMPSRRVQVSTMGGSQPRWRADGGELFFVGLDARLMSVSVRAGETFDTPPPRALFDTFLDPLALRQSYAVSPDGKRFLLQLPSGVASALTVVLNWPALLQRPR